MESLAPFLQGTCTPYNMPVYPGAQCKIANALFEQSPAWKRALTCSRKSRTPKGIGSEKFGLRGVDSRGSTPYDGLSSSNLPAQCWDW